MKGQTWKPESMCEQAGPVIAVLLLQQLARRYQAEARRLAAIFEREDAGFARAAAAGARAWAAELRAACFQFLLWRRPGG